MGAWEWLWDTIADSLNKSIELPKKYHSKVERLVTDLDLDEKRTIGLNVFKRLFVQEVQDKCGSDNLEPFAWALEIVASQLVLTIEDGSNPLLSAVLKNSPKDVRKELGKMPRAQRPCAVVGVTAAELA